MVRKGLNKETVDKMIELRKMGDSYRDIKKKLNVSKSSCMKYLKDIPIDPDYSTQQWQEAEREAVEVLKRNGFENILNLNQVSNAPFWDYHCTKKDKRWLIDVTINSQKNVSDKIFRMVDGFKHAILYKNGNGWKLVEINTSEVKL